MADQGASPQPKLITELKTSAHLMLLDAGVFCIFHMPGGQVPDPRTGLPGVRLSLPPMPGQAGRIRISTFQSARSRRTAGSAARKGPRSSASRAARHRSWSRSTKRRTARRRRRGCRSCG